MDATLRIKNLSIALEALSRIVGAATCYYNVERLLEIEIQKFREEKEKETQWPQRGPAKSKSDDDDIPF